MAFTAEEGGGSSYVFLCALAGGGGKHSNAHVMRGRSVVVRGHEGSSAVVHGHGGSGAVIHGQGGKGLEGRKKAFGGKREESARENEK